MELPPRTRRILPCATMAAVATGTTSAHAENTTDHGLPHRGERNYLRARGEYRPVGQHERSASELPPRTRRIHKNKITLTTLLGTTSAHAENTAIATAIEAQPWELPPRTRRILQLRAPKSGRSGTTSAHAENTALMAVWCMTCWNYLRARGEYLVRGNRLVVPMELPPRTRRIP